MDASRFRELFNGYVARHGATINDVASRLGVSWGTVYRWLKLADDRKIRLRHVKRIDSLLR